MRSIFLAIFGVFLVVGVAIETGIPTSKQDVIAAPIVDQESPDAVFLAIAIPFVGKLEGLRLTAYQDIVGVWTICYGETRGVQAGDAYTKAECDAMLAANLIDYRERLRPSFTADTIENRLPAPRDVAFTSFAYNVGVAGAGGSTAVKRLNAGNVSGACEALGWWNKAGGRVVRGLVNRRAEETELCLAGS